MNDQRGVITADHNRTDGENARLGISPRMPTARCPETWSDDGYLSPNTC